MKTTRIWAILLLLSCSPQGDKPQGILHLVPDEIARVPAGEPFSRPRKRMDIQQLDAALRAATGGIGWTKRVGSADVNQFTELSRTLGAADYLDVTQENLEPNLTFSKFLNDAALSTCDALMQVEVTKQQNQRVFITLAKLDDTWVSDPASIRANLRAVIKRFLALDYAGDDPRLEPWLWLWQTAQQQSGDPIIAWKATCVALVSHPHFYTY